MGLTADAFKFSLGYADSFPGLRINNYTQAKEDFISFYNTHNFSSLLDYYKATSLDLPVVNSSDAFNDLKMGIKVGDMKSAFIKKIFMSFEICYAYISKTTGRSLYTKANAAIKFVDRTKDIASISTGLWIQLVTDLDFQNTLFPPIYAPAFTQNKILVSTERYVTLDKRDAPCVPNNKVPDTYEAFSCAVECQNKRYLELIKCQLFRYCTASAAKGPTRYCHLAEKLAYKGWRLGDFKASEENEKITQECLKLCPARCDRVIYQASLQWQTTKEDEERELSPKNSTAPKKTLVEVFVDHIANYEGGTLTLMEVNTYSLFELISNVGGTLGLFVGATLMTFVQLIGFCVECVVEKLCKRSKD